MIRHISLGLLLLALTACHTNRSIRLDTREKIISAYTGSLKHWDKDGDGRLSRPEVEAMVNDEFRRLARGLPAGEVHPELQMERQQMFDQIMARDTNKDGYLSLSELVKEPLVNFSCMDADHDAKLSKAEVHSAIDRCAPPPFRGDAPRS